MKSFGGRQKDFKIVIVKFNRVGVHPVFVEM